MCVCVCVCTRACVCVSVSVSIPCLLLLKCQQLNVVINMNVHLYNFFVQYTYLDQSVCKLFSTFIAIVMVNISNAPVPTIVGIVMRVHPLIPIVMLLLFSVTMVTVLLFVIRSFIK